MTDLKPKHTKLSRRIVYIVGQYGKCSTKDLKAKIEGFYSNIPAEDIDEQIEKQLN